MMPLLGLALRLLLMSPKSNAWIAAIHEKRNIVRSGLKLAKRLGEIRVGYTKILDAQAYAAAAVAGHRYLQARGACGRNRLKCQLNGRLKKSENGV